MNKNKLLETNVYMGIDTIQVKSDAETAVSRSNAPYISKTLTKDVDSSTVFYKLNPDKAMNTNIYDYSTYNGAVEYMINALELVNPVKTRIDFRIDSFDDNYNDLLKLNKLLILLISEQYKVNNRYESRDPLTLQELTIRVQNERIEVENYNKAIEEPDGDVKSRLEFRSKKLYDDTAEAVKEKREFNLWCERLDKSVTAENFDRLQKKLTDILVNEYKKVAQNGVTVNQFLYKYENSIFTSRQLTEFYSQLGYKDPEQQAKKYKSRHKVEYFSMKNLADYVKKIKSSGAVFFKN